VIETTMEKIFTAAKLPADQARLLASRAPGSGDWLNAIPLASIGLWMDDSSVRIASALRLGAKMVVEHTCRCGAKVESNGHHGLSCMRSAGRHMRHAQVNDLLQRAMMKAGTSAIREPVGLCSDDKRPDGVTLIPWCRGKSLVWDFTCPDTLAQSHITSTKQTAGAAAEVAETNKLSKYQELSSLYEVTPIAVETLGAWGSRGWAICRGTGSSHCKMYSRASFHRLFETVNLHCGSTWQCEIDLRHP
jgi:hypothetical protein